MQRAVSQSCAPAVYHHSSVPGLSSGPQRREPCVAPPAVGVEGIAWRDGRARSARGQWVVRPESPEKGGRDLWACEARVGGSCGLSVLPLANGVDGADTIAAVGVAALSGEACSAATGGREGESSAPTLSPSAVAERLSGTILLHRPSASLGKGLALRERGGLRAGVPQLAVCVVVGGESSARKWSPPATVGSTSGCAPAAACTSARASPATIAVSLPSAVAEGALAGGGDRPGNRARAFAEPEPATVCLPSRNRGFGSRPVVARRSNV